MKINDGMKEWGNVGVKDWTVHEIKELRRNGITDWWNKGTRE